MERNGIRLTPQVAVQLRVECCHNDTPKEDWPTQPSIDTTAYEHVSTVRAQDKVNRRQEALGLDRQVEKSARQKDAEEAGPSGIRPRSTSDRSRSSLRDRGLRETISRRATVGRGPRTPPGR